MPLSIDKQIVYLEDRIKKDKKKITALKKKKCDQLTKAANAEQKKIITELVKQGKSTEEISALIKGGERSIIAPPKAKTLSSSVSYSSATGKYELVLDADGYPCGVYQSSAPVLLGELARTWESSGAVVLPKNEQ